MFNAYRWFEMYPDYRDRLATMALVLGVFQDLGEGLHTTWTLVPKD